MTIKLVKIRKSGRICTPFPWESKNAPCPWNTATHSRVVIPFTAAERKNARPGKRSHIQIIANRNLEAVKESRLTVQ